MRWMLIAKAYAPATISIFIIIALCAPVLSLRLAHYIAMVWIVVIVSPLLMIPTVMQQEKMFRALATYLDKKRAGEVVTSEECVNAFYASTAFPQRQFIMAVLLWWIGGVSITYGLNYKFDDFSTYTALIMLAAVLAGTLTSSIIQYLILTRHLNPLKIVLAKEIGDPQLRRENVSTVSISTKLMVSMAGLVVVALVFGVAVAQIQGDRNQERMLTYSQADVLAQVIEIAEAGLSVEMAVPMIRRSSQTLVSGFVLIPSAVVRTYEERVIRGEESAEKVLAELREDSRRWIEPLAFEEQEIEDEVLFLVEVKSILESALRDKDKIGDSDDIDTGHIYAWTRLPMGDSRILVGVMPLSRVHREMVASWRVLVFVICINFFIAIAISKLVAGELSRGTRAVDDRLRRVASGNLVSGDAFESDDELGELGRSIEEMTNSLRDTVLQVAEAADGVENTAHNLTVAAQGVDEATSAQSGSITQASDEMETISRGIRDISASAASLDQSVDESSNSVTELRGVGMELDTNASELAQKAEGSSSSIAEMTQSVRQVAENTNTLSEAASQAVQSMDSMTMGVLDVQQAAADTETLSVRVVEAADRGSDRVQKTIEGIETIREVVGVAQGVVGSLEERSKEIGAIINVIDDIADETNLLALNAAIIAAQAGDHGRSFSVVADEIKDLADRVITNTKEISTVIVAIQDEGSNAVGVIDRGAESVQSAVELSAEAGTSLEEITTAARESGDRIRGIVSSVEEHRNAANQVVELMEAVNAEVTRIRNAGDEQSRGSQFILEMTHSLVDVAQRVNRITDEQNKSTDHIARNAVSVRDSSNAINEALQQQLDACDAVGTSFSGMVDRNELNQSAVEELGSAVSELQAQARRLRENVEQFETEEEGTNSILDNSDPDGSVS